MARLKEKIIYFDADKNIYTRDKINELIGKEGEILKDTSRSYVKALKSNGESILVKRPIEKNKRKWIRLLTLFRKSEAIKVLESMRYLNQNGILTNTPLLCVEYKKYGMVFDSYIFCRYLEGELVSSKNSKEVIQVIKDIHKLGYLHGDTQRRNFLINSGRIGTIDSNLKKKSFGKISENLEYIGFAVDIKEAYSHIDMEKKAYKAAEFLYNLFRAKRRISKKLKNIIRKG